MPVIEPKEKNIDEIAMKVFLKSIEVLGGPRKLIEYRNLTWLPSLLEAAYAIVLQKERLWDVKKIAAYLGLTENTVRNILRADPEKLKAKIEALQKGEKLEKDVRVHTAGALAKMAYKQVNKEE